MGSFRMTRGFLLNNQLTDFSIPATDASGPIANRVGPGKRPRSSMAPTIVFAKAADGSRGDFVMGTGSPGGATIIQFVAKTLVGVLDWGLNAQQATAMVNFGSANTATTNVGGEHPNVDATNNGDNDPLVKGLRATGAYGERRGPVERHQHHRPHVRRRIAWHWWAAPIRVAKDSSSAIRSGLEMWAKSNGQQPG